MSDTQTVVLVTGASRGLGFAVARQLGAMGAHIVAVARTVGGLEALDDDMTASGGSTTLVPLDLTDGEALTRLVAAISGRWGKLDLFVHAAVHAPPLSSVASISAKDMERSWATNVAALGGLIAAVEPLLRASKGRAVILDDPMAGKFSGAYSSSKAGARAIATAWAEECKTLGPDVSLYAPPSMPTAVRARFFPGEARDDLMSPDQAAMEMIRNLKIVV